MEGSSFNTSSAAFNLPPSLSTSASFRGGRSYAAAAKGGSYLNRGHPPHPHQPATLSSSFASMSFQPMSFSFGAGSYSKSQVHSLMASATTTNRARTDAELTGTYECCGNTHNGLHDLLEHVEDAHPFADPEPNAPAATGVPQIGFSPQVMAMDMDMDVAETPNLGTIEERASGAGSTRSSMSPTTAPNIMNYPVPTSASSSKPSTPNEGAPSPAPLSISDVLTSPFASSLLSSPRQPRPQTQPPSAASNASTSSSPPEGSLATPSTSQMPSPVFTVPKVGPTRGFLGSVNRAPQQRFDRAFNEVVAGSPKSMELSLPKVKSDTPTAVAPGVLFASAVAGLGIPTTPPVPGQKADAAPAASAVAAVDGTTTGKVSTEAQLPQPSPFTTHKPWRCPNPGCELLTPYFMTLADILR
jgi:transcription factor SFP1